MIVFLLFVLAILIGFITGYIVGIDTTLTDTMINNFEQEDENAKE